MVKHIVSIVNHNTTSAEEGFWVDWAVFCQFGFLYNVTELTTLKEELQTVNKLRIKKWSKWRMKEFVDHMPFYNLVKKINS